ncbi:hypothetical protein ACO2Q3_12045 [Caulobacter sp. KR2-114]|uniref:hypothetical protein n=1 Tax=Caulobacter sp. KR2-114 TaxID=3400912 RepID=UPI003C0C35DE
MTSLGDAETEGRGEARAAARISMDYVLRTVRLLMELHDGSVLDALIFHSIVAANVGHLGRDGQAAWPAHEPPPDELRRPVSILSVATGLGLPFETVRRRVNRMIADGRCRRQSGGVIVPAFALAGRRGAGGADRNLANLRRCFRDLAKAGVNLG